MITTLREFVAGATLNERVVTVVEVFTISHSTTASPVTSRTCTITSFVPSECVQAIEVAVLSPIVNVFFNPKFTSVSGVTTTVEEERASVSASVECSASQRVVVVALSTFACDMIQLAHTVA